MDNKIKEAELAKSVSPFINDNDTFECEVKYYIVDKGNGKGKFLVKGVNEDFDDKKNSSSFKIVFRLPTQKDVITLFALQMKMVKTNNDIDMFRSIAEMEYNRLLTLIKSWTLDRPCTHDNISALYPSFIKAMVIAIREEIGMDGIV